VGLGEVFAKLGLCGGQGVVFFARPGLGDFFTERAGMLAVESFLKRGSDRFGFREIANHIGPSYTLQNRQMPAGRQKQGQPDHHGGHGSKNGKPVQHLKSV
jgi:hypothetical protein